MADGVEIVLDRPRHVTYTWGDLKALQTRLGKPTGEIVADLGKLDVNAIQHLLFAGLHHEDARLRFDDVGGLIEKYVDGGKTLYAGLHTLSSSTGNAILVKLLSASSSAMGALNPGTVQVTFTCYSCRAAQWATPIAGPLSSDHRYWKLQWETTTTGRNFLGWISIVGDSAA